MADVEGWNVITNGTSVVVGVLTFNTGLATSGPALGQPIFAAINGIRTDGTTTSQAHPLPVVDSNAESVLATIATNTGGGATVAAQTAGNASLTTIATAQGVGATGIAQPTGGTGVLGFLSGIYARLQATLTISGAVTSTDAGSGATGVAQPTGGSGLSGWMSGIYNVLAALGILVKPAPLTGVPLDVTQITTAGTAVNVLAAGHCTAGGYVIPSAAAFLNQIGAAGTVAVGNTIPVNAGQVCVLFPNPAAVSMNIASGASVAVAGYGFT
jgi:hypothetical protein